jgi:2'-5' RNA ligase
MGLHRLFVAIELPAEIKEQLPRLRESVPGARWVPVDQLHLTMRFIGEVSEETLTAVRAALAGVHEKSFAITMEGVGHFPPRKPPRVLWVGLTAGPELADLQQQIEAALQSVGLAAEERPFSPHITLARLRETPPSAVSSYEQRHAGFHCPPFAVTDFHLYESTLTGKGAIHQQLATYPLSA